MARSATRGSGRTDAPMLRDDCASMASTCCVPVAGSIVTSMATSLGSARRVAFTAGFGNAPRPRGRLDLPPQRAPRLFNRLAGAPPPLVAGGGGALHHHPHEEHRRP